MAQKPKRYVVVCQRKTETTQVDTYEHSCKSKTEAFWWVENKMSDSWEPVKIHDRKTNKVVKWFNEPREGSGI